MSHPREPQTTSRHLLGADPVDLRRLDPTRTGQNRSRSAAADRVLARVLATSREQATPAVPTARRSCHRSAWRRRRWALSGVAAAAAAAAVVVPSLVADSGSAAYASWTPSPSSMSAERAAALQADCLQMADASGYGGRQVAGLSEDRGSYAFTVVATPTGVGSCFLLAEPPVGDAGEQEQGAASWGPAADLPAPAVDGTTVSWGATSSTAAGEFTSAVGRVGADVNAVRLTTAGGRSVVATVAEGYFAAWWPGRYQDQLTVQVTTTDGRTNERVLRNGQR